MVSSLEAGMNRAVAFAVGAMMIFTGIAGFVIGEVGASTPKPTWTYQVEDDAPACWYTQGHADTAIECGPLSWAPARARLVQP